jgi:hypothetical protein
VRPGRCLPGNDALAPREPLAWLLKPLFRDMDGCKGMPWALSVLSYVQHRLPLCGAGAGHPDVAWGVTYTCPGIGLLASPQESETFP